MKDKDKSTSKEKIAIIGANCLFPGANNLEEFWELLVENKCSIQNIDDNDLGRSIANYLDENPGVMDKVCSMKKGLVRDFNFDPEGYNISADFLSNLDDLFKWTVHVSGEALKDAGYFDNKEILKKTGLIFGNFCNPTKSSKEYFRPIITNLLNESLKVNDIHDMHLNCEIEDKDRNIEDTMVFSGPSSVTCDALSLGGPTYAVDAACSSSFYVIKQACYYLLSGKMDMMLASASCKPAVLTDKLIFNFFGAQNADKKCKPLNDDSDSIVSGEGSATIVLKRLSDAINDGDKIYAVIDSIGVSNDGGGTNLLAPKLEGQLLAYESAYNDNTDSKNIDYIECHGTGTRIGDQTELNSIEQFFSEGATAPHIGAVKGNTGHLLAASGMVGLFKVLLSMKHGIIPATLNIDSPLSSKGLKIGANVISKNTPWPMKSKIKRAGINAFGFGGTNAHMVFSEYCPEYHKNTGDSEILLQKTAITGMGVHFGSYANLDEFKNALYYSKKDFRDISSDRWLGLDNKSELIYDNGFDIGVIGKGSYIDLFNFDFLKNKISPQENPAPLMKNLVMLNAAEQALIDAGFKKGEKSNIGVIIGIESDQVSNRAFERVEIGWQLRNMCEENGLDIDNERFCEIESILKDSIYYEPTVAGLMGKIANITANRISSVWGLTGPSFVMGSMENTAAKAIDLARYMLTFEKMDAVLVGCIDMQGDLENALIKTKLSGNEKLVHMGEGAGAIVLERVSDLVVNKKMHYSVLESVSQAKPFEMGIHAENKNLTEICMEKALNEASLSKNCISYVETFFDSYDSRFESEIKTFNTFYAKSNEYCWAGSVKDTVGDMFAASGMASLIKMSLCLYYRFIPAVKIDNDRKNWGDEKGLSIRFNTKKTIPWEKLATKRYACISGREISGTYSGMILSEPDIEHRIEKSYLCNFESTPFLMGGRSEIELQESIDGIMDRLQTQNDFIEISKKLYENYDKIKDHNDYYFLTIIGRNVKDIKDELKYAKRGVSLAFKNGSVWYSQKGSYFTATPVPANSKIAFMFPIGGAENYRLLETLLFLFPSYITFFDLYKEKYSIDFNLFHDPISGKTADAEKEVLNDIGNNRSMVLQAVNGQLVAEIFKNEFNLEPDIVYGCSFGELSILNAFEMYYENKDNSKNITKPLIETKIKTLLETTIIKLKDEKYIKEYFKDDKNDIKWINFFVHGNIQLLEKQVAKEKYVFLTIKCSNKEAFIAGNKSDCERIINEIGLISQPTQTTFVHTPIAKCLMDNIVEEINIRDFEFFDYYPFDVYFSFDKKSHIVTKDIFIKVVDNCLCQKMDFANFTEEIYKDGAKIFIDVGPQEFCARWVSDILKGKDIASVSVNKQTGTIESVFIGLLSTLIGNRKKIDLSKFFSRPKSFISKHSYVKQVKNTNTNVYTAIRESILHELIPSHKISEKIIDIKKDIMIPKQNVNDDSILYPNNKEYMPRDYSLQNKLFENYINFLKLQNEFLNKMVPNGYLPSAMENISSEKYSSSEKSISIRANQNKKQSDFIHEKTNHESKKNRVIWDEHELVEMTNGRLSSVLGPTYEKIDEQDIRLRMPSPPFMFVTRITALNAKKGLYEPSMIEMVYDIKADAWFLINDTIPSLVIWESSHCMILLLSYLGLDEDFGKEYKYRVTDSNTTFLHDNILKPGGSFKNIITIKSFIKAENKLIVFYNALTYFDDVLFMKTEASGGLFTDKDLQNSKGILEVKKNIKTINKSVQKLKAYLQCEKRSFNDNDVSNLKNGRPDLCFGKEFINYKKHKRLLCSEKLDMLDRVLFIDMDGGHYEQGILVGEKTIDSTHWAFDAHFKNDSVFPGTMMMEGCIQLLHFYSYFLGYHFNPEKPVKISSVQNIAGNSSFRGQIPRKETVLKYVIHIKETHMEPNVQIIIDIEVFNEEKKIITSKNFGMELVRDYK